MSNIPSSSQPVQIEGTRFRGPGSESLIQQIGALANYCLDSVTNLFARMVIAEKQYSQVGDIITSMLTQSQVQAVRGVGWILADGRAINGTALATLQAATDNPDPNHAPDLRGYFMRGKDNGAGHNPDGNITLGTLSAGHNEAHAHGTADPGHYHTFDNTGAGGPQYTIALADTSHEVTGTTGGLGATPASWRGDDSDMAKATGVTINSDGGNESRPVNVTVNFFVRIN